MRTLFVSEKIMENEDLKNEIIYDFEHSTWSSTSYQLQVDDMENVYAIKLSEEFKEVATFEEVATKE